MAAGQRIDSDGDDDDGDGGGGDGLTGPLIRSGGTFYILFEPPKAAPSSHLK